MDKFGEYKELNDRFVLIQEVGRGGMGSVYQATDKILDRIVAIKAIHKEYSREINEQPLNEARAAAKLRHKNIVTVFDIYDFKGESFIISEFVSGRDLDSLLRKGPLPIFEGLRIAIEISLGLEYAHSKNVIHRDIKPNNILIEEVDRRVVITDFGIAKIVDGFSKTKDDTSVINYIIGTPYFMSPEQIRGDNVDEKTDIYSLGVTFYYMFTGQIPLVGGNIKEIFNKHLNEKPEAPDKLRNGIVPELSALIMQMMEKDPYKRPSMKKIIEVLQYIIIRNKNTVGNEVRQEEISGFTTIGNKTIPTGFFETEAIAKSTFFEDESIRYNKIQETLKFYRDHLNKEYQMLSNQANTTYKLWLACVSLGFAVLIAGLIILIFFGKITEGIITTSNAAIVYFIQNLFNKREDHYRKLASIKNKHLEYGNQWLLIIQSIDGIEDPDEKKKRQSKLVEVLTEKLKEYDVGHHD